MGWDQCGICVKPTIFQAGELTDLVQVSCITAFDHSIVLVNAITCIIFKVYNILHLELCPRPHDTPPPQVLMSISIATRSLTPSIQKYN